MNSDAIINYNLKYKMLSSFFVGFFIITVIFVSFALLSKSSVKKNENEKLFFADKVADLYKLEYSRIDDNLFFQRDLSSYKKAIKINQKKEYREGVFLYNMGDDTFLKIFWHKDDVLDIQLDKVVIEEHLKN